MENRFFKRENTRKDKDNEICLDISKKKYKMESAIVLKTAHNVL